LLISIPALGFIKLSILLFYQRLFVMSKRDWRDLTNVSIWVMVVLVSMWTIAFFLRYLFACGVHFDIWWTNAQNIMTECGDFNNILNVLAISDFVCDVIVLILPLRTVSLPQAAGLGS
jgi:ABC-type multidrug transport system permease subunit